MTQDTVMDALRGVKYPGFSRDIVSFGLVRSVEVAPSGAVSVRMALTTHDDAAVKRIGEAVETALKAIGVGAPEISIEVDRPPASPASQQTGPATTSPGALSKVKHVVAIASGKGGVGKSTFSVNLAVALSRELAARGRPLRAGLMDCDIYGPCVPLMLGLRDRPAVTAEEHLVPVENLGVRAMSMGLLLDPDQPVLLDLSAKTVRFGDRTVPVEMRESARTLFLEGTWDSAATLIGAMDRVRETAARLPYLAWSPGR